MAGELAARFGAARLDALAGGVARGDSDATIAASVPVPGFAAAARELLAAARASAAPTGETAAWLRGVAAGYSHGAGEVRAESVWSGPGTHQVPLRATAAVLTELVAGARHELLLATYSARPHPPLLATLGEALDRGVAITVLVETLQGAGSALAGAEPAAAFASLPGIELWHWPVTARAAAGARMHAKLAVADRAVLLVSSANLTGAGAGSNVEAGLLVRGGSAPQRAAEHVTELRASGVLARL
jgi:phosphatidylserine/phosphatidylglycerophosphate/cardiolipin synthase-like enzyme